MSYSHLAARFRVFVFVSLAMATAGCNALSAPPAEPVIYRKAGDAWTTRKRDVHLYQCVDASMVCRGPASHVNVTYQCRCE
jgi:hypothetical protein